MSASRPIFVLIDGHAVAYRQYFALSTSGFTTSAGEPTNAVYGFTRMLLDILQKEKPDYLAVSFDLGLSGRDEWYGEYKGTREKMPDDLSTQMERIKQLVRAFNMPVLAVEGYEADDVIGTVTRQAQREGVDIRIITGDRDILQLLTPHVTVQLPQRGGPDDVFDIPRFREKYGIEPAQLVDLKALMGDTSDNIPGVKGIGEKTAASLLQSYGTLDEIYAHINEIKGATQKKLIEGQEMAYLSQRLATIQCDVPITLNLPDCVAHDYDAAVVIDLFRELEFRTFTARLAGKHDDDQPTADAVQSAAHAGTDGFDGPVRTIIVRDEAGLRALVNTLKGAQSIAWDVETTSVDQMAAELVGISLSVDGHTGYYIPVGHQPEGAATLFEQPAVQQLPLQTVLDALRGPLTNPKIPKSAHNAVYDLVVMQRYGVDVFPVAFDSMIAEWIRDPNSKFLGLKSFALQYLGVSMTPISDLIGTGKKQRTIDTVPVEQVAPYAAADAAITHRAVMFLRPKLEEQGLMDLFNTLDMPLVPVIAAMQRAGVRLDVDFLAQMSATLADKLALLEHEIHTLGGGYGEFNINSPKQLNDVLFGKLGLSVQGLKKTTHGYSTDAGTLEALRGQHPIVDEILDYRELAKLKSTYVDALPALVNPHTGRVHTSYNQTGTTTGRISSSNPNLQNIPIRTEIGREVRRAFIAQPGYVMLSVDYSQIELRVLAHISGDETLLKAFAQGQDIHAATAAAVNNIALDQVTYEQRSFAKRVNFGLIYGMGPYRLAQENNMSFNQAQTFIEAYFNRLPRVNEYLEQTRRQARETGIVRTLLGRQRRFDVLLNPNVNRQIQESELRAAINMPIQGTAADIMKRAMIDLHTELTRRKSRALMTLQVHDELVLEVPEDEINAIQKVVVDIMENAYPLDAPLKANAEIGPNWRDMTPV